MSERETLAEGDMGRVAGVEVVGSSGTPPFPLLSTRGGRPPRGSDATSGLQGVFPSDAAEGLRGAFTERGRRLLDSAYQRIVAGDVAIGMDEIVLGTRRLRDEDAVLWQRFVSEQCRSHPLAALLREDPFTRRSFEKPCGYCGDPEMLEFIFSPRSRSRSLSDTAEAIFNYTTDGPAPRSVRARAAMTAELLDSLAVGRPLRVLAVMAGFLWEAGMSSAARNGAVEKYVAFDGDLRTLARIDAAGYGPSITTYQGSIRSLLRGKSVFRNYDLVYSALCDNLGDPIADHFIAGLAEALAPGGTLLLSNFAPDLVDIGYMEAFMDWNLVYRDEAELLALVTAAAGNALAESTTYRDPHGNIVFVEAKAFGQSGKRADAPRPNVKPRARV